MRRLIFGLICLYAFTFGQASFGQSLEPAAQAAIERGQAAMTEALQTYLKHYPDQPLWREAINAGKEAVHFAPNRPEPLRFLAEVYSRSNWYGPAYQSWNALLDLGSKLDFEAEPLFVKVASELGYTSYQRKDLNTALAYFQRIVDVVSYDQNAYVWAGRILIETKRPLQAIPYWQAVIEHDGSDDRAKYFLKLAQDQAEWGVDAVNAFREGIQFYDESDLGRAKERFARAVAANETYAEAWAWLGRVSFEQQQYQDAVNYYGEANKLEPTNETYRYFLEESRRRMGG